jgi:hypothetical protein
VERLWIAGAPFAEFGHLRVVSRTPHKWDPVCPPPTGLVRPVRIDPTGLTGPRDLHEQLERDGDPDLPAVALT